MAGFAVDDVVVRGVQRKGRGRRHDERREGGQGPADPRSDLSDAHLHPPSLQKNCKSSDVHSLERANSIIAQAEAMLYSGFPIVLSEERKAIVLFS